MATSLAITGPDQLRQIAWLMLAAIAVPLAFAPAAALAGFLPADDSRSGFLAVALGAWALFAGLVTVALARLVLAPAVRPSPRTWLILAAGCIATGLAEGSLVAWTEARFGQFDPEYIGSTNLLSAFLVLATVAFTSLTVTRGLALGASAVGAVAAAAGLVVLAILNAAGAFDGIGEASWGLAVAFVVAGGFILLTTAPSVFDGCRRFLKRR